MVESSDEPEPKRLRSAEPDLCVFVGAEKKEYQYHSQIMASHSTYIDTMLATPMKESESLQISFPDLTPDLWELMVKSLDPSEVRGLSIENARKLAPPYDKYSFESGLKICDQVLSEIFKENRGFEDVKPTHDLDSLIDSYLVANDANLAETLKFGDKYFQGALKSVGQYGRIIFSANHLKKLAPVIVKRRLLKDERDEDVLNPLWPDYFVTCCQNWKRAQAIQSAIVGLRLSGSGCAADGEFHLETFFGFEYQSDRKVEWGGVNRIVSIGCVENDWLIYGETEPEVDEDGEPLDDASVDSKVLWRNPFSENQPVPPKTGWEPADDLCHGAIPKIEYIYKRNPKEKRRAFLPI